jgi:hypothetical protein
VKFGWLLPLQRVLQPLEARCYAQLYLWQSEHARNRYFQFLTRKRITCRDAECLLQDFCASAQYFRDEKRGSKGELNGEKQVNLGL